MTENLSKSHKCLHPRGFTLIELSLVVVVIAALMLLGTHFYKQQRDMLMVKQTAVEMQQIAQAAQAYYVNDTNNYWPSNVNQLAGVKRCGPLFLNNGGTCAGLNSYQISVPAGYSAQGATLTGSKSISNPPTVIGSPVCPSGQPSLDCYCPRTELSINCLCPDPNYPGHNCTRDVPPSPAPKKASALIVSTTVPNSYIATQLASLLPMAKVNGTTVSMTQPAPNETFKDISLSLPELYDMMDDEGVIMVKSIYLALVGESRMTNAKVSAEDRLKTNSNRVEVTLPTCPQGWYPGYDTALTQVIANVGSASMGSRGIYICRQDYDFYPNQTGATYFVAKTNRRTVTDYYSAVALVITYCVPPKVATCSGNSSVCNLDMKDKFTGYTQIKPIPPGLPKADTCQFANFTG